MHIKLSTPLTVPTLRAHRGAVGLVMALACMALLSACGSSKSSTTSTTNLDTKRVALSIEQTVLSQRHIHVAVTCPVTVQQAVGKTFVCTAVGHTIKKPVKETRTPFVVTIQNSKGYVTYKGE